MIDCTRLKTSIYQFFVDNSLLFNQPCLLCDLPNQRPICQLCLQQLADCSPACDVCAMPRFNRNSPCSYCLQHRFLPYKSVSGFLYHQQAKKLLHQIKYQGHFFALTQLCQLVLQRIDYDNSPDALCFVPSHTNKLKQRGFNQSHQLAKTLSSMLSIPIYHGVYKVKTTPSLVGLNAQQRQECLKHAFQCHRNCPKHVAIIDDLLTTGSTANAVSESLLQAGCDKIQLWTLARTQL